MKIQPAYCFLPVEQPRLCSAGQSVHEFLRFGSNGSVLEQGPGKVPLLLSSLFDRIAVHNGLQVGINPGAIDDIWWKGYSSPEGVLKENTTHRARWEIVYFWMEEVPGWTEESWGKGRCQENQWTRAECGALNSRVVCWVLHQLSEPASRQRLTVLQPSAAG